MLRLNNKQLTDYKHIVSAHSFSRAHFSTYCYYASVRGNTFQVLSLNCQIGPVVQCQPIFPLWIMNPLFISRELFNRRQKHLLSVLDSGQITPIKHSPRVKFQWLSMSFCWLPAIKCSVERGIHLQPSETISSANLYVGQTPEPHPKA